MRRQHKLPVELAQYQNDLRELTQDKCYRGWAMDEEDVQRLEGRLSGYHRLRRGGDRVIYAERFDGGND